MSREIISGKCAILRDPGEGWSLGAWLGPWDLGSSVLAAASLWNKFIVSASFWERALMKPSPGRLVHECANWVDRAFGWGCCIALFLVGPGAGLLSGASSG